MDDGFKRQQENPGPLGQTSSGAEIDEFKKMLVDTNPILLATTFCVYTSVRWDIDDRFLFCIVYSSFWRSKMVRVKEKDLTDLDISHWRSKKDNTGVSFRTIISNVVM